MRRRDLITVIGGAAFALPLAARAQQKAMPVIGYLASAGLSSSFGAGFRHGLSEIGYIEGQNIAIEYRFAEGRYDQLPALAADLVQRQVAVIVVDGLPATLAAQAAAPTLPIVFWTGGDPVDQGLVASLNHPGGNLTGVGMFNNNLGAKRVELLRELVPNAAVFALLVNPTSRATEVQTRDAETAARAKGAQLHILEASTEGEIEIAFASLVNQPAHALMVASDTYFHDLREQLVSLAADHAIPAIYTVRDYAVAGGLITYASSNTGTSDTLGYYAGRILKGEKPAELPVMRPTKFDLVVNLKTARALGLAVPQLLLAQADEVIE